MWNMRQAFLVWNCPVHCWKSGIPGCAHRCRRHLPFTVTTITAPHISKMPLQDGATPVKDIVLYKKRLETECKSKEVSSATPTTAVSWMRLSGQLLTQAKWSRDAKKIKYGDWGFQHEKETGISFLWLDIHSRSLFCLCITEKGRYVEGAEMTHHLEQLHAYHWAWQLVWISHGTPGHSTLQGAGLEPSCCYSTWEGCLSSANIQQ